MKNVKINPLGTYLSSTVWKFQDFTATQILNVKSEILEAQNYHFDNCKGSEFGF